MRGWLEKVNNVLFKLTGKKFKSRIINYARCPGCGNFETRRILRILQQCPVCKNDYSNFSAGNDLDNRSCR